MNLIQGLLNDIVDAKTPLSSILRKVRILASNLKNEKFKKWVDNELNGYQSVDDVPDYRRGHTQSYGYFVGPLGSHIGDQPIPTLNLPKPIAKLASELNLIDGVRGLESLLESSELVFRIQWPADAVAFVQDKIIQGFNCISAWRSLSRAEIEQVLDTVRNKLLNFLLELKEKYPNVSKSEDAIADVPKDQISSVVNTYIFGSHNVVASGFGVDQKVMHQIVENDLDSLLKYMKEIDVPKDEVKELEKAIEADGKRKESNKFGPKVRAWIGKMIEKILEGAWKVAISSAPTLLTNALSKYYGWQ